MELNPVTALQAVNLINSAFLRDRQRENLRWRGRGQFGAQHDGVNFNQRIEKWAAIRSFSIDQVETAVEAREQGWNQPDELQALILIAFRREAPGQVFDDGNRVLPVQAVFGVQHCCALEDVDPVAREKISGQVR